MSQSGDSTHISQRLEVGRQVLEGLANIASKLEHAKEGLVRSAYLSGNLDELPPSVKRLWESLDKDVAAMSAKDIAAKLQQLEQRLAERLSTLMPLIEKVCSADDRGEEIKIEGFRGQLNELSRVASTSLAIRLLAQRKQYKLPPSQLPVSADSLRARAQQVKGIERKHKLRVISHMRDMVSATTEMLGNPSLDAATRSMFQGVLNDLKSNARHLANGGSFGTLPHPIETVEMSDEEEADELSLAEESQVDTNVVRTQPMQAVSVTAPATSTQSVSPTQQPDARSSVASSATTATLAPSPNAAKPKPKPRPQAIAPRPVTPPVAHHPVVRLWKHLRAWMRAPMGVSWAEARLMVDDDDF